MFGLLNIIALQGRAARSLIESAQNDLGLLVTVANVVCYDIRADIDGGCV